MFREISILFAHFPCNKIHSWHDSMSAPPVANTPPGGYAPPENFAFAFIVRFPQFSAGRFNVSIRLE